MDAGKAGGHEVTRFGARGHRLCGPFRRARPSSPLAVVADRRPVRAATHAAQACRDHCRLGDLRMFSGQPPPDLAMTVPMIAQTPGVGPRTPEDLVHTLGCFGAKRRQLSQVPTLK